MEVLEIIGFAAAGLGAMGAFPQVYKTWQTKKADELSYLTLVFLFTQMLLWLVYGISLGSKPMLLSNTVALFAIGSIILLKFIYRNNK